MSDTTPDAHDTAARLAIIDDRLDAGAARMDAMQRELAANTEVTTEIRDLLASFKGGFRVAGWLGVVAKWLGGLAAAATALWVLIYQATHGGQLPK